MTSDADRLRRDIKALRLWVKQELAWREASSRMHGVTPLRQVRDRLDAILRGES